MTEALFILNPMKENIQFYNEDVEQSIDNEKVSQWLALIAANHESEIEAITYIFCSDDYLLEINKSYLDHDYYTDIITFPYKQGKVLSSDIFISIDRVKDNAIEMKTEYNDELLRVISHGLLHLIGYNDKSNRQAKEMREEEDKCIALFKSL